VNRDRRICPPRQTDRQTDRQTEKKTKDPRQPECRGFFCGGHATRREAAQPSASRTTNTLSAPLPTPPAPEQRLARPAARPALPRGATRGSRREHQAEPRAKRLDPTRKRRAHDAIVSDKLIGNLGNPYCRRSRLTDLRIRSRRRRKTRDRPAGPAAQRGCGSGARSVSAKCPRTVANASRPARRNAGPPDDPVAISGEIVNRMGARWRFSRSKTMARQLQSASLRKPSRRLLPRAARGED